MGEQPKIVYAEPQDYFPEETRKKYKLGEYEESKELKQIKAVMLGHAVADALGVPVEFCSRDELCENPVTTMMGYGAYNVPEGCWSDDTSMALATLDSLKNGKIDYDEIMDNFVAWCTRDEYTPTGEMFDIGRTCLRAIRNYLATDGKPALECGLKDQLDNGNGSLMRIHPMSLYLYYKGVPTEEAIEIIHNTSAITHAHALSKIACGIYSFVLWELLKNPCVDSIRTGLRLASEHYLDFEDMFCFYRLLDCDFYKTPENEICSTGYVVTTLEAAIWCILTTNDYKECVLKAVNLGGDTDTIAAVAGGLAGALYGFDSIPTLWLDTLKRRDYIEKMCDEVYCFPEK